MKKRPYALSIAGFDPSGGAGVLADIKTFEAYKTLGLAVSTALTFQNEDSFLGVDWHPEQLITRQLEPLLKRYPIKCAKIGLVENMERLHQLVATLTRYNPNTKIIWDPIFKASAGFTFHESVEATELEKAAKKLYLVTPNRTEITTIYPGLEPIDGAKRLSKFCKVFLKGGHDTHHPGKDRLFENMQERAYNPRKIAPHPKHGSGCIVSAAITAGVARGYPLHRAVLKGKSYVTKVLLSNETLLGYHT